MGAGNEVQKVKIIFHVRATIRHVHGQGLTQVNFDIGIPILGTSNLGAQNRR